MEEGRRRAKNLGLARYLSDKPCVRGHKNIVRYTSNAICVECDNEVLAPRRREKKRATWVPKVVVGTCDNCGVSFNKTNNANRHCSLECRFWSKADKAGENECWPWAGALSGSGHGLFNLGGPRDKCVIVNAHRVSYQMATGVKILEMKPKKAGDLFVCHTCDNPPCVNPKHLYLGSNYTNQQDRKNRKRPMSRKGYRKYRDRVGEVLALHKGGMAQMAIAEKTGINQASISEMIRGVYLDKT